MRRKFLLQTLAAMLALAAAPAMAQANWPTKPIRFVVPYPAGGGTDYLARLIGERLSKRVGQPVLVENRSGAAGAIGVAEVAKAPPDGHTVLMTINDPLVNNVALFKSLPYDPQKDLRFVAQVVRSPALISASPNSGIRSVEDLRRLVQAGARLSYASWGVGGLGHLAGETFNRELNAKMVHVPQRGEGPVVQDLLSNTVSIGLSSVGTAKQHVAAGKIVPIGLMNPRRLEAIPNVPTMKELGFADPLYEASVWMGALVPAATPTPIVNKLSEEIRAIANTPEVRNLLVDRGFEMHVTSPDEATANYKREFEVITKRIRDLGIEPQ